MLRENIHNHEPESIITDSDIQVAQMFKHQTYIQLSTIPY